jgi:hypothetical protein
MASTDQVRQYLAYWMQLGKPVVIGNSKSTSGNSKILPQPVIQGDRFSPAFEDCWRQIMAANLNNSYLEGTEQSLGELLTPDWELSACARCTMPVPVKTLGVASLTCPCNDLSSWPNTELPLPRSPVSSQSRLDQIRDRLKSHTT